MVNTATQHNKCRAARAGVQEYDRLAHSVSEQKRTILVLNCGSSSVKFALFECAQEEPRKILFGAVERIGLTSGRWIIRDSARRIKVEQSLACKDHEEALGLIVNWLERSANNFCFDAVGHRLAHGGDEGDRPTIVTADVECKLNELAALAPLHMPHNLAGIRLVRQRIPSARQVACFDTAFHHSMPHIAQITGLPRKFATERIRRYGYHGLSCESVMSNLRLRFGDKIDRERVLISHLGNGSSITAIKGGKSLDTTMGFSTLSGLPMGTRCGDLDPGLLLFLMQTRGQSADDLQLLLYEESGLKGISGISRNMADLLTHRDRPEARDAINYYCYQARKSLLALTAVLGGLDRLIFTGGIGENAPEVRAEILTGLEFTGLSLDAARNSRNERRISRERSAIYIEIVESDEETMIARHVQDLLGLRSSGSRDVRHG